MSPVSPSPSDSLNGVQDFGPPPSRPYVDLSQDLSVDPNSRDYEYEDC